MKRNFSDKEMQKIVDETIFAPEGADFSLVEMMIVSEIMLIYKKGIKDSRKITVENYDSEPYRFVWGVLELTGGSKMIDKLKLMEIMLHMQGIVKKIISGL